jgi:hypothetical protein
MTDKVSYEFEVIFQFLIWRPATTYGIKSYAVTNLKIKEVTENIITIGTSPNDEIRLNWNLDTTISATDVEDYINKIAQEIGSPESVDITYDGTNVSTGAGNIDLGTARMTIANDDVLYVETVNQGTTLTSIDTNIQTNTDSVVSQGTTLESIDTNIQTNTNSVVSQGTTLESIYTGISQLNYLGGATQNPLYVEQVFSSNSNMYYNDMGLDVRLNQDFYPAIIRIGSLHTELVFGVVSAGFGNNEANRISLGMPANDANIRLFTRPTSAGSVYIASTSTNDTSAGTGARTVFIRGLLETSPGVYEEGSETIIMNGQTVVTSSNSNWWRLNLAFVLTTGSSTYNEGDIYISADNSFTSGQADTSIMITVPATWSVSTSGNYSVGTYETFVFTKGNWFSDPQNNNTRLREEYIQPFDGPRYQVSYYVPVFSSFNYDGAGSYTAETDVILTIWGSGSTDYFSYYVEYVLVDNRLINSTPIGFTGT